MDKNDGKNKYDKNAYRESLDLYPNIFSAKVRSALRAINNGPKQRILSYLFRHGPAKEEDLAKAFGHLRLYDSILNQLLAARLIQKNNNNNAATTIIMLTDFGRRFLEAVISSGGSIRQ